MTGALPNALILGPQRTGSSWCAQYLANRGDVAGPKWVKETFFFDQEHHRGLDWYAGFFDQGGARIVEVAPSYFGNPLVPERVHHALGDIRLVAVLRDPVDRAFSHYHHLLRYGLARGGFREVVERSELWREGQAGAALARWEEVFGRHTVQLLFFEDLVRSPVQFAAALDTCLGVVPHRPDAVPDGPVNAQARAPFPWLAHTATRVAAGLRHRNAHRLVQFARTVPGARRLVYGQKTSAQAMLPFDDRQWFYARFVANDLKKLAGRVPDGQLARWAL